MPDIREDNLGLGARREKWTDGALESRPITFQEEQHLPDLVHEQGGLQDIQVAAKDRAGPEVHLVRPPEESPQ